MADPEFEFFPPVGFEWDEEKSQTNLINTASPSMTPAKFFAGRLSSEGQAATTRSDGSRSENLMIESCR
jgi:hypothetical protein